MGKRGPKPAGKVKIKWSTGFAYAIGLIASDGCLSPSGRHIIFVSEDREQLFNLMKALGIEMKISDTDKAHPNVKRVQFGDVLFYQFLMSIGLMPNKSRVIGKIQIPDEYFFDFLRGSFDGDGSTYSYWDKRWKSSFMFYTTFVSASEPHIVWLRETIERFLNIHGHVTHGGPKQVLHQLKYAKAESLKLLRRMYQGKNVIYLSRKRLKIDEMLRIVGEKL